MRSRGFTLVEAIVSVALLGVGIVAALGALSEMTRTETRIRESSLLRRLAQSKFDEVVATEELAQAPLDGTFEDLGRPDVTFEVESEPATVENMVIVRTTTYFTSRGAESGTTMTTILYQPPQTQEQPQGAGR